MAMAPSDISQRFNQFVSEDLKVSIIKIIFDCYNNSWRECKQVFDGPEFKDLLPHYRRAKIDAALRSIPQTLGVKTSAEINKARNSYHAVLIVGGVQMTASAVEVRGQMPRNAIFRKTYAEAAQMKLFENNTSGNENLPLYGIIIHSATEDQKEPAFLEIRFPDEEYTQYLGDRIDLFKEFPDIVASLKVPVEETVSAEPKVTPRRQIAKKQESA